MNLEKKAEKIINRLKYHPFYKSILNELKSKKFENLPVINKKDVIGREKEFIIRPHFFEKLKVIFGKNRIIKKYKPVTAFFTSGRSTDPMPVFYTKADLEKISNYGKWLFNKIKKLYSLKDVRVQISFPAAPHLAFWESYYNLLKTDAFYIPLGAGRTEYQLKIMEKFKINVLVGMPTYIKYLSEKAVEKNINSNIKVILLGGEYLHKGLREKIKNNFAQIGKEPVILNVYGLTEGKIAFSELEEEGGFVCLPYNYWEKIDGNLIFSHIEFKGSFFVRYNTGDKLKGEIETKKNHQIIYGEFQRVSDYKKVKGVLINFAELQKLIESFNEIKDYYIEIRKKDKKDPYSQDELALKIYTEANKENLKWDLIEKIKSFFEITPQIYFVNKQEIYSKIIGDLKGKRVFDLRV